jgi:hypothetical protein
MTVVEHLAALRAAEPLLVRRGDQRVPGPVLVLPEASESWVARVADVVTEPGW